MRRQRGFTLVELLVVVAIIALLLSLLLPALNRARELAQLTLCGTNQRSISQAIFMYTEDHNGYLPYGYIAGTTPEYPGGPGFTTWWRRVGAMEDAQHDEHRYGTIRYDNQEFSGTQWHCPLIDQAPGPHWTNEFGGSGSDRFSAHWGMNSFLHAVRNSVSNRNSRGGFGHERPVRMWELPSRLVMIGDGRLIGDDRKYFVETINHQYGLAWGEFEPWPVSFVDGTVPQHAGAVNTIGVGGQLMQINRWEPNDLYNKFYFDSTATSPDTSEPNPDDNRRDDDRRNNRR